ncbi:MAG TPA: helix-turn-helix transcriptional regulator [Candidatus Limnocylindrales bacterium]|nr:helix-turn-helix transcriptional regulator [Candidatus Limnocylindrales bacterium]
MTTRHGPVARAVERALEDEARVRADLARARRGSGISREIVGKACGLSRTGIERIESGTRRSTIRELAAFGAVVGLDVRLRAFPAGDPIRDAGQVRLLERLRVRLHPSLRWSTEVPLPMEGDLRAWDAVIRGRAWRLPVEAETVLDDVQATERRLALKQRDGGEDHVILLVADTRRNRRALAAAPGAFADLPMRTREILAALGDGRRPAASGIVIL